MTKSSTSAPARLALSAPALILLVLAWIATVDNLTLWQQIDDRLDLFTLQGAGYALALFGLMVLLLALPLFVVGQRYLLKPILVFSVLLCGVLAYFTRQLGVVYDADMVRNALETVRDRNVMEGAELVSVAMLRYVALVSLPPLLLIAFTKVNYGSILRDSLTRAGHAVLLVTVVVALVMVNFKYLTYFSRENNDLQAYLNPYYPIKSVRKLVRQANASEGVAFRELGQDAVQQKADTARIVGVMVVGETARADHFSLNGYARDTNPHLGKLDIVNFTDTTACGTSTAFSVPCMFSFLNEADYSPEKAKEQSNALDVLARAGVKTIWIDNNSSCKDVCSRIESRNLTREPDPRSPLYVDGAWQDEILIDELDRYLDSTSDDVLLVMHTMGSHGPAYYRRFPGNFARFSPYCKSKAPQDCESSAIINAYDNTIAYTDYVLASLIWKLERRHDQSFLMYASDHGESLGENGVYLHGLPRFLAPEAQTQVPMLAWFSPALLRSHPVGVVPDGVVQDARKVSHDNLSASLLGLFDVRTKLYDPDLDLFAVEQVPIRQARTEAESK